MSLFTGIGIPFRYTTQMSGFLLLLALLMLGTFGQIIAQTVTVLNHETLQPINDVALFNRQRGFSTLTGEDGKAALQNVQAGDTVTFQHPSYYREHLTVNELKKSGYKVYLISRTVFLEEFVIAVNKTKETRRKVANRVEIIPPKDVQFQSSSSSPDMLEKTGNVFVQRSLAGGGSPVIRGFEGNKILVVVDGVRQNNAISDGSHSRIVNTIDPAALKRTEVVYGPGSLIYGSDALGGVMHFYTKDPTFSTGDSLRVHGSAFTRYASANHERTAHIDLNVGSQKFASFSSATFSNYENLRTGNIRHPSYPDFGKRFSHQSREDSVDAQIVNDEVNRQRFTEYDRLYLLQKFRYRPHDELDLGLNLQVTSTSDLPNYGQLTEPVSAEEIDIPNRTSLTDDSLADDSQPELQDHPLKYGEWRFGPNTKYQAIASAKLSNQSLLYDQAKIVGAYQNIHEERITRHFGKPWRTFRQEALNKYTLNIDATKDVDGQFLQYGLSATYNDVESKAFSRNIFTGERKPTFTQYPSGGGTMQTYAGYFKFNIDFSDELRLTQGFRYSKILMRGKFDESKFFDFTFDQVELNTSAFSGAFNLTYNPTEKWKASAMASSGYRVPNLDDAAKFASPDHGTVIVPNPKLKPEYAYNLEGSVNGQPIDRVNVGLTGYATFLKNAIVRQPYDLNNRDTIGFEGVDSRVLANVNIGTAVVTGASLFLDIEMNRHITLSNRVNFTSGRNKSDDVPLAHIPPFYGKSSLHYGRGRLKSEVNIRYNGWKRAADFGSYGADNLDEATEDGTPAWWTLNAVASYSLGNRMSLQASLENILDHHYRPFSSEMSAPGRNLILTLRAEF